MKRKLSIFVSIFFLVAFAVGFISPQTGHAFWYGVDVSDKLDGETEPDPETDMTGPEALHNAAVNLIGDAGSGPLSYSPFGDNNNNNPNGDEGVTINNPYKTWDGYTLISDLGSVECAGMPAAPPPPSFCFPFPPPGESCPSTCSAILIDMEGNMVNGWEMRWGVAKMLPNSDVMMGISTGGFGFEGDLGQVDWNGNVIKQWGAYHHDHQREGNPVNYYAPSLKAQTESGINMWLDREAVTNTDISEDQVLEDDVIWQVPYDWNGDYEDPSVWKWRASDHFFRSEEEGNFDLGLGFEDDPAAMWAINNIRIGGFLRDADIDYTHANSLSWLGPNPWFHKGGPFGKHHKGRFFERLKSKWWRKDYRFHPENMIIDFRSMNIIAIIAGIDHPHGLWKKGAIVWRVGPFYTPDKPESKIGQIIGQHHAHMIPKGLPGWGNILVFDNGGMAGFGALLPGLKDRDGNSLGHYPNTLRDYSRIVEFNPITLKVVWEYKMAKPTEDYDEDGEIKGNERKFFATHYSGMQRMPNGNTLICEGNTGRVFEVTKKGEVVWEYFHPAGRGFISGIYRATRVPKHWVEPHLNSANELVPEE